jgi:hypothetical protein
MPIRQQPAFLASNEKAKRQIGEILNFSTFPSEGIQIKNGYGRAVLNIKIYGARGTSNAQVLPTKEPEQMWEVKGLNLTR